MVNFLTDDFFKERRRNNTLLIISTVIVLLVAIASNFILDIYLENLLLDLKQEVIEEKIRKVEGDLVEIQRISDKKEEVRREIDERNSRASNFISTAMIFEELSLLSSERLEFINFNLVGESFSIIGVAADSNSLNPLNNSLNSSNLFESFYFEDIDKIGDLIEFRIRGRLKGGG